MANHRGASGLGKGAPFCGSFSSSCDTSRNRLKQLQLPPVSAFRMVQMRSSAHEPRPWIISANQQILHIGNLGRPVMTHGQLVQIRTQCNHLDRGTGKLCHSTSHCAPWHIRNSKIVLLLKSVIKDLAASSASEENRKYAFENACQHAIY